MPTTKKANRSLLIRVPEVLYKSLARRAEAYNLSMAELAREAVYEGFPRVVRRLQRQEKVFQIILDEIVCKWCGEELRNGNCDSCSALIREVAAERLKERQNRKEVAK